jgi:hypothetical protein
MMIIGYLHDCMSHIASKQQLGQTSVTKEYLLETCFGIIKSLQLKNKFCNYVHLIMLQNIVLKLQERSSRLYRYCTLLYYQHSLERCKSELASILLNYLSSNREKLLAKKRKSM